MITKVLQFVAKTDEAEKDIKSLNNEIKETEADLSGVESAADKATGGMISGFKGAVSGIKGVVKGFKSMRMAIIASGIGALVLVISSVAAAFTSTEEGQNKFNKLMSILGSITGNLIDVLASLGNVIIDAFTNPVESIKKFTKLIKENIINRFEGLLELIPQLGKAVGLLFKGEFAEAGKVATNAVAKVSLGVENIVEKTQEAIEKTQEFVDELIEEGKIAAQIADQRAKADKLERNLLVERAKANRDRADLLEKAVNKEKFSTSQRIQFLKDAGALEDEITQKEIQAAKLRLDAKVAENALAGSTKEDLQEEAQLRANLINLETAKLTKQKEVTSQIIALTNEEKAAQKALQDKKIANDKENEAKANEKFRKQQEQLKKELEIQEQQFNLLQELTNTEQEQEIFKLMQQYDKKFELAVGNAELEKALAEQQAKDIDAINKKFDDKRVADNKAANDKIKANEQALQDSKFQLASSALNSISALANLVAQDNEQKAKAAFNINKAVGIAQVGINTSQAIMKAAAETTDFTPIQALRTANMVAMGVAGALQIAMIAKQKFQPQGGGTSTASPSVSTGGVAGGTSAPSQPPSFNVVGQSGFNQIAGALSQQGPVQAFVVAGEVTTQQQLDNAIVNTATLGN